MKTSFKCLLVLTAGACVTAVIASSVRPQRTIARFSTTFEGRLDTQAHNAILSARKLDGATIPPGGVLSFNDIVGSWSRDQGYKKAPVSFSGTLVSTWGGGVCQTSTTLYNAGLLAGMEVVERHHHQFAANYVPPGRDAAVAFPNLDLKLRNPYSHPLTLSVRANRDRVVLEILGKESIPGVSVYERVSQVRSAGSFTLGRGSLGRVRNPGKPGFQVEVYRTMRGERELVSSDSYPAMSRVVEYRTPGQ